MLAAEVLARVEPADLAVLARRRRGRGWRRWLPPTCRARAGARGTPLKLAQWYGFVERLGCAQENGCPWVA